MLNSNVVSMFDQKPLNTLPANHAPLETKVTQNYKGDTENMFEVLESPISGMYGEIPNKKLCL